MHHDLVNQWLNKKIFPCKSVLCDDSKYVICAFLVNRWCVVYSVLVRYLRFPPCVSYDVTTCVPNPVEGFTLVSMFIYLVVHSEFVR